MNIHEFSKELDAKFAIHAAETKMTQPWFAYYELRNDKEKVTRKYRIGQKRIAEYGIIDWCHPLAKAYYECDVGETFENEREWGVADENQYKQLSGVVDTKAKVIAGNMTINQLFVKTDSEEFALIKDTTNVFIPIEGVSRYYFRHDTDGLPDILAHITSEQYALITASSDSPLIIQGKAGSGKTSVALYRVSYLTKAVEGVTSTPLVPSKILFVMFNKALSDFVKLSLSKHGLDDVVLDTFHGWALTEIKRAYKGNIQPEPKSGTEYEVASSLKKPASILSAIDEFVLRQTEKMKAWLKVTLAPYENEQSFFTMFDEHTTGPIVRRLIDMRKKVLVLRNEADGSEEKRLEQIRSIFTNAVKRMTLYKEDLYVLLTTPAFLAEIMPEADKNELEILKQFQFLLQKREKGARHPGPWIAFEDFALILRLIQVKTGGFPDSSNDDVMLYDHLVIDETQDFGAVELKVLLDAVHSKTGVTIVGDINQKIVPQNDFIGWQKLEDDLGIDSAKVTHLNVGHRCTEPIMSLADTIIGDNLSKGRPGSLPILISNDQEHGWLGGVAKVIYRRLSDTPLAHIAIVCPDRNNVQPLLKELHTTMSLLFADIESFSPDIRAGHNKNFVFAPGVTVTNMKQVKGLEFDTVIIIDVSEEHYPDNRDGKRLLYTTITRAQEELYFAGEQELGSLLQGALAKGLILPEKQDIAEIEFNPEEDEMPFGI